jgi:hypothetical protein
MISGPFKYRSEYHAIVGASQRKKNAYLFYLGVPIITDDIQDLQNGQNDRSTPMTTALTKGSPAPSIAVVADAPAEVAVMADTGSAARHWF